MSDRPRWPWYSIIFLEVLQLLSLLPWLVLAGFSTAWAPRPFIAVVWSYPLWLLAAGALAWFLYGRGRYGMAVLVSLIFTFPIPICLFLVYQIKLPS